MNITYLNDTQIIFDGMEGEINNNPDFIKFIQN